MKQKKLPENRQLFIDDRLVQFKTQQQELYQLQKHKRRRMIIIQLQSPPKKPRSLHLSSHLLPKPKPSPQKQRRRRMIIMQLQSPPKIPRLSLHLLSHLLSHPQFVAVNSLMFNPPKFFYNVSYDRVLDLFPISSKDFACIKRQKMHYCLM